MANPIISAALASLGVKDDKDKQNSIIAAALGAARKVPTAKTHPIVSAAVKAISTPTLDAQGITAAEVKRRAAAGEPIVKTGLRPATGAQNAAAIASAAVAGVGEGLGNMIAAPVDAMADIVTAGPARRMIQTLRGKEPTPPAMPVSALATRAADDAERTLNRAMGVDEGVATTGAAPAVRLATGILTPAPGVGALVRGAGRGAKVAEKAATVAEDVTKLSPHQTHLLAEKIAKENGWDITSVGQREGPAQPQTAITPTVNAAADTVAENVAAAARQAKSPVAATIGGRVKQAVIKTIEFVQDDWYRVKKLVEDRQVKITDASDPYTAEILFHGRVATRIEEAKALVTDIDKEIVGTAKQHGISSQSVSDDLNDFLHARHAPERNATHGAVAAGITNKEAAAMMARVNAQPYGAAVQRIADRLTKLNRQTLDLLFEGEVISKAFYDRLRTAYEHHVPLNRIFEDTEDIGSALATRPLDVRSTGIKRAVGSKRQVADITGNIVANHEQAIIRAEKNRVDLATLRFARDNPELRLFSEIRPKAIGKDFKGNTLTERINDPQVLTLRVKGEPVYLRIKDPHLATALRGVNRHQVDGVLRFVQAFTRLYSGLHTRFNPAFFAPNKLKDLQEAVIYLASKKEFGARGAIRAVAGDVGSMRDILDAMRGANTEGARLYRQMRMDGGTTGGMGLSSRAQVELDLMRIRKINRSAPRAAADAVVRVVDYMNTIIEDSTRLDAYRIALERGVSRPRAGRIAKEASVNFNKFGRGGPQINALYMFANASIQGSTKMIRAMKNPKVAATVVTGVALATAATSHWNDTVDPQWRDKVSKWDRTSSLPVMLPPSKDGSANYIVIPLAWGIKPIKVAMDAALDAMSGHGGTPAETMSKVLATASEAYNPLGGTDVTSALTPSILDVPVEIARNQAWSGSMIRPDFDRAAPRSERFFRSLPETPSGRVAIGVSKRLSFMGIEISPADLKYAYEAYIGGAGKTASQFIDTVTSLGRGELVPIRGMPIVSRFGRSVTPEQIEAQQKRKQAQIEAERRRVRRLSSR